MLENIRNVLEAKYPAELVRVLLQSYLEIKHNYALGKYEASELNGGKFVESCVRILQFETDPSQRYAPLGSSIRNMIDTLRNFERTSANIHDSYRLHIPRVLMGIYNIRNRRGVGHLGGDVSANLMDATYIVSAANWVLAELYRLAQGVSPEESIRVIQKIVTPKIPLIHEIGNIKRVLKPGLSYKEQILLILYAIFPEFRSVQDLLQDTEYSNPSRFRREILLTLHKERLIEYNQKQDTCMLLPPGIQYVESHILPKEDLR